MPTHVLCTVSVLHLQGYVKCSLAHPSTSAPTGYPPQWTSRGMTFPAVLPSAEHRDASESGRVHGRGHGRVCDRGCDDRDGLVGRKSPSFPPPATRA